MSAYFPSHYLPSVGGDGNGSVSTLPCSFPGLPGRYDGQYVGLCGGSGASGSAGLTGHYGTSPNPTGSSAAQHGLNGGGTPDVNGCPTRSPGELNGYDTAGNHQQSHGVNGVSPGVSPLERWGNMPPNTVASRDYNPQTSPPCSDGSIESCGPTSNNHSSRYNTQIPFYPWMGVVGK